MEKTLHQVIKDVEWRIYTHRNGRKDVSDENGDFVLDNGTDLDVWDALKQRGVYER